MEAINTIVMQHLWLRKKDRRFNNCKFGFDQFRS